MLRVSRCLSVGLLSAILLACSGKVESSVASTTTPQINRENLDAAQVGPIPSFVDMYGPSLELKNAIFNKWQMLTAKCMHRAGFDEYVPIPVYAGPTRRPKYESLNLETVKKFGFDGPPDTATESNSIEAEVQRKMDSDHEYQFALIGTGEKYGSGCAGRAMAETYGPKGEFSNLSADLGNLDSEVEILVRNTAEFGELQKSWSRCMKRTGHDFVDRSRMLEILAGSQNSKAAKILVAIEDFACRHEIKFGPVHDALYVENFGRVAEHEFVKLGQIKEQVKKFAD